MKTMKTLLLGTIIGLTGLNAYAQSPQMPAASPAASISQTFGLTKIDINYSSPAVKGRQIWGGLVPYDSVWRTGANKITDISFSTDVTVGGQKVKKGRYALLTIPGRNSWTVIINSDADQWGAYDYKKSLDMARFSVSPQMVGDSKERLAFMIDPTSDSTATISMCWEKAKVSFNVMADTKGMIQKSINDYTGGQWRNLANSANYYADNNMDLKSAESWARESVGLKENYYNRYVLAKVLHAEGNDKEALKYATEAKTIGDKANDEPYQNNKEKVAKLIADLSAMAPAKKK
ncbi:MAG TPA: DUF2911 domain-containing protein [Bacteroidia bacterium]|nr:DUF2911 domain-containing protein [Bacteroidia bacterium]